MGNCHPQPLSTSESNMSPPMEIINGSCDLPRAVGHPGILQIEVVQAQNIPEAIPDVHPTCMVVIRHPCIIEPIVSYTVSNSRSPIWHFSTTIKYSPLDCNIAIEVHDPNASELIGISALSTANARPEIEHTQWLALSGGRVGKSGALSMLHINLVWIPYDKDTFVSTRPMISNWQISPPNPLSGPETPIFVRDEDHILRSPLSPLSPLNSPIFSPTYIKFDPTLI